MIVGLGDLVCVVCCVSINQLCFASVGVVIDDINSYVYFGCYCFILK